MNTMSAVPSTPPRRPLSPAGAGSLAGRMPGPRCTFITREPARSLLEELVDHVIRRQPEIGQAARLDAALAAQSHRRLGVLDERMQTIQHRRAADLANAVLREQQHRNAATRNHDVDA